MKLFRLVIPILAGLAMAMGAVTALARSQPAPASPPVPLAFETNLSATGGAEKMHADASGRLWISQDSDPNANVRMFDPATHAYTDYTGFESPNDAQLGPDGNVWMYLDHDGWLARMDPGSGMVTTWTVPGLLDVSLAFDGNGSVWALDGSTPAIDSFAPNSHQLCNMALPNSGGGSYGGSFLTEHGGALWLGDGINTGLARITPTTDVSPTYTFWPVNANGLSPQPGGVSFAPNGVVWFSDEVSGTIGRLETDANRLTLFYPPNGFAPQQLDYFLGKVWFTGSSQSDVTSTIGYLDPATAVGTTPLVVIPTMTVLTPACADAGIGLTFTAGISTGVSAFSSLVLTTTVDAQGTAYEIPGGSQPAALVRVGPYLWSTDVGRNTLVEVIVPTTLYLPLVQR